MNLLAFQKQYPDLSNFLGACFPDADLEDLSDTEVAEEFALFSSSPEDRRLVLEQGSLLLALEPFPWKAVGDEANRYFTGPVEAKEWLSSVLVTVRRASRGEPRSGAESVGDRSP